MVDGTKKPDGGVNIDARDDEFLNTERRHLYALHSVESIDKARVARGILAVRQYGGWYMEAERIHYDHVQDGAKNSPSLYDQVKP